MKKEASAAKAEDSPRPLFRLELDHDDVFWGSKQISPEELNDGDVALDHAPDNPPGQYRWNRDARRLEPMPKEAQKSAPGAPTLEQAFYDLQKIVMDNTALTVRTPRLAAWCAWFEKTLDGAKGGKP